eukprot:s1487_g7.t1
MQLPGAVKMRKETGDAQYQPHALPPGQPLAVPTTWEDLKIRRGPSPDLPKAGRGHTFATMVAISIITISKELMLACRQLGHVVSEALAAIVAATVVNNQPNQGGFFSEKPIDENDAKTVVEEAAKKILSKERPGISTLRLQADYEMAFADIEQANQKHLSLAKDAEEKTLAWISKFTAKFDEDFDTLTSLYKKIYHFLLLRCTSPSGEPKPPKDVAVEREVAAALESVFPRVGLRSFVALTGAEKAAQLQELTGIVLGIRLFNMHQRKGGAGLPSVIDVHKKLNSEELLDNLSKEAEEVTELCQDYSDVLVAASGSLRSKQVEGLIDDKELQRLQCDLLYHRQYLCYLLNLQEDVSLSLEKLRKGQAVLREDGLWGVLKREFPKIRSFRGAEILGTFLARV